MHTERGSDPSERPSLLFECRGLDVCVGQRTLVRGLDLKVDPGSMLAILGPNGSGKSLSLHTFAGLRPPKAGELRISGRPLKHWPRRALAREMALLPLKPYCSAGIRISLGGNGNRRVTSRSHRTRWLR
jgi:ABC-type cobalamin/Fe3+-siderophores transport system ATPase subunit